MHHLRANALIAICSFIVSACAQLNVPVREVPVPSAKVLPSQTETVLPARSEPVLPSLPETDVSPQSRTVPPSEAETVVAAQAETARLTQAEMVVPAPTAPEPEGRPSVTYSDAPAVPDEPNAAAPTAPGATSSVDPSITLPESATAVAGQPVLETLSKPAYSNVWERIRAGFKLPEINDPLVRKWENFYAVRPEYWQRINERGKRYLYFITAEIERRGMPLEIALLPIIESAFNPEALSRARASGIWQFVPATGKIYGLQQNWWLDNRRDVTVATISALDYLENLYAMFGDWQLALASYNWGEGAVQRAMNRNRAKHMPTDYAHLKIPTETRNYLPKLQAVKNLILAPEKFGLGLPAIPDLPFFTMVTTFRQIDVALAARLADMPLEEFKNLNPAHNRPVMAGEGEQRIMLPYDKVETFVTNLDAYELPLVSWRPYQVLTGERLDQIAPRFGIGVDELKRVNGLTGRSKMDPGYTLLVPARTGEALAGRIPTAIFKDAPSVGPAWHRVRRGETLAAIALRHGVVPADLKRLNGLSTVSVTAGQTLRLHDGVSAKSGQPRSKSGKRNLKKPPVTPTRRR